MADLIGLINDISPSVKLAWIGVPVWAAVQIVWYRRARVLPGEAASLAGSWAAGRQFPSVTRPPETDPIDARRAGVARSAHLAAGTVDINIDSDAEVEIAFGADELDEFQEAVAPRRRSNRRRRSTASNAPGTDVTDFAMDVPKVS